MSNKLPNIKNKFSMTEEEKKSVLVFYNVSEEQKKAKEREVSLLIASACGIDIKDI